jgi:hypothetical protein
MKDPGLRNGLLGGVVVILYFALLYAVRKELFLNPFLQWGSLVVYVAFMWRAGREDRAANGADRPFPVLVRAPFTAFVITNLLYWMFFYGLHLADPQLLELETQAQIEYFREQLAAGTGDPRQSNQLREQIQYLEQAGMSQPLGHVLLRFAMGALGGFALAAGVVALQRSAAD